jgi:hypothetical protein
MAAGVTLRFALEFVLDYRDAPLWRMRAGMGDVIFTPFYQVLDRRGVRIRLFHAVREVVPAPDGRAVARVHIDRQADLVDGRYDPFVRVKGLDCWPNEPLWDKLVGGDRLKKARVNFEIRLGQNRRRHGEARGRPRLRRRRARFFARDEEDGCAEARDARLRLRAHAEGQRLGGDALDAALADEGLAAYGPEPLMGTLPEPYDSWADMSELLEAEDWAAAESIASIQYLCGVAELPAAEGDPIEQGHDMAEASSQEWIARNAGAVWPLGSWPEPVAEPSELIAEHYFRGNVEPSELYVLTPAGTVASRLVSGRLFGLREPCPRGRLDADAL